MTMEEFYTKYNLDKYNFAEIASVGTRTLVKYANGEEIRRDALKRIELAMQIAEEKDLVRPRIEDYRRGVFISKYDMWKHFEDCNIYVATFKHLIKKRALV